MSRDGQDGDEGRRSDGRRGSLAGLGASVLGVVGALLASGCEAKTAKDGPAEAVTAKDRPTESEPTLVRIRANVEARVEEDGVTLGTIRAPDGFVVKLPRSEVLRTWVVKAEGYADQTVQVRPVMGAVTIDVELKRPAPDAPR